MPRPLSTYLSTLGLTSIAVLGIWLLSAGPSRAERAFLAKSTGSLCADSIARQERLLGIPHQLLAAISLAESGRWDEKNQEIVAWPWTVMAEGEGRYFARKAEAVAEVRALQRRGVTNIDVGCMQINLHHHPDAFANVEEAFDPTANTAYAARFLTSLRGSAGSWLRAAAHYHSRTPDRAKAYGDKVRRVWAGLGGGTTGEGALQARRPSGPATAILADAIPSEESVFDDVFATSAVAVVVTPAAVRTAMILPIDRERTTAFNGQLRGRRLAAQGGNVAPVESNSSSMALRNAGLAAVNLPSQDAFAAKRQDQLARWRREGRL